MRNVLIILIMMVISSSCLSNDKNKLVTIYPAPKGEELSQEYIVAVERKQVPVYKAKIAPADKERRWKAMDDHANSADYFDTAAFAYFDINGKVTVTVTIPSTINSAKILPSSANIVPTIKGKTLTFVLNKPQKLTIDINGEWIRSLHLFANPFETDVPDKNDPDVIYFGPGIHEITHMEVGDNKTIYIAGGAIVKAMIGADEKFGISSYSGLKTYSPTIVLKGNNIKVRGRGILDAGSCTTHARNLLVVRGTDILLEDIIFRDPSTWTIPVWNSQNVRIDNIKILGYRANSDGIDICSSSNVAVNDCFIRTLDDLVVIKTPGKRGEARHIVVQGCVLWNQLAHALSIGAELTNDVDDVVFRNCDVIHEQGREWSLRVFHSDAATISNVRFENIRIEESQRLISLWIGDAVWSKDKERGNIRDIVFKDIDAHGTPLNIELVGADKDHKVDGVLFQNVKINGQALTQQNIKSNDNVANVSVKP